MACSIAAHNASGTPRPRRSGTGSVATRLITGRIDSSVSRTNAGRPETRWKSVDASEYTSDETCRARPGQDLRGCMGHAGGHDPAACLLTRISHPSDAEVGELGLTERRHEDVGRLHVAVDHPPSMRGLQRRGHLHAHRGDLGPRPRPVSHDPVLERAPRREGHDQIGLAVRREARLVQRDDVGMVRQRAHGLAFTDESGLSHVVEHTQREHLDGDGPLVGRLLGPVHDRKAAAADLDRALDSRDTQIARHGAQR